MARYDKGGEKFQKIVPKEQDRSIKFPSFRDGRRYDEVVRGKQNAQNTMTMVQKSTENRGVNSMEKGPGTTGIGEGKGPKITLRISENGTMTGKLKTAIVADFDEKTSPKQATKMVEDADVKCVCVSSLTPFNLILFFDSEEDDKKVTDISSPLWKTFKSLRRWSEEVECMERIACLECHGIHPKYWNTENIIKIGELWGNVLHMDNVAKGVNSLTYARLMVRTKTKFRVDTCINLACGSESCEVWVIEKECGECFRFEGRNQIETEDLDEREEGGSAHVEETELCSREWACESRGEPGKELNEAGVQQHIQENANEIMDPIMLDLLHKFTPCDTAAQRSLWEHEIEGYIKREREHHIESPLNGDTHLHILSDCSNTSSEEDTPLEAFSCGNLVQ
ncbi:unnamed protein product [Amaranthus hypochondriacus]